MRFFLTIALMLSAIGAALAAPASCPQQAGNPLTQVNLYDGPFEDNAVLVPDSNNKNRSVWTVTSVYNDKRSVNVECLYKNGRVEKLAIPNRVKTCELLSGTRDGASFTCK